MGFFWVKIGNCLFGLMKFHWSYFPFQHKCHSEQHSLVFNNDHFQPQNHLTSRDLDLEMDDIERHARLKQDFEGTSWKRYDPWDWLKFIQFYLPWMNIKSIESYCDHNADIGIMIKMTDERYFYDDINKHRAILTQKIMIFQLIKSKSTLFSSNYIILKIMWPE